MGQFSVEKPDLPGSVLSGNQHSSLSVPRSNAIVRGNKRYRNPVYGVHFIDALHLMEHPEVGLIEQVEQGCYFARGVKRQGSVRPTAAFWSVLEETTEATFTCTPACAIGRVQDHQPIALMGRKDSKTGKAHPINYSDTAHTRRLRNQVTQINTWLGEAPLTIVLKEGEEHPMAKVHFGAGAGWNRPQPVDFSQRSVRRIFSNGSWQQGGRLFGACWEVMRREDRFRCLRIDGEPVANVDFKQLFVRLGYLEQGLTPPEQDDLYAIPGYEGCREGLKAITNALLFAEKAFRHWPYGRSAMFPKGTKLSDVVAAIKVKHAPIIGIFETGAGHRLAFVESTILIDVIGVLAELGTAALPLHDSVLVAASKAEQAKAVMEQSREVYSVPVSLPVKIDLGGMDGTAGF
jgi:hypothetical protein